MKLEDAIEKAEYHYAGMEIALEEYNVYGDKEYLELAQWHKRELDKARQYC